MQLYSWLELKYILMFRKVLQLTIGLTTMSVANQGSTELALWRYLQYIATQLHLCRYSCVSSCILLQDDLANGQLHTKLLSVLFFMNCKWVETQSQHEILCLYSSQLRMYIAIAIVIMHSLNKWPYRGNISHIAFLLFAWNRLQCSE